MPPNGTGVTITNPLVLYRSLVATSQIKSDPVQLRLALHLQKLYEKLIDYEPSIEYSQRLQQLTRAVNASQNVAPPSQSTDVRSIGTRGIWTSLLAQKEKRDSVALTRVLTSYEQAMGLQSPKGLVLHGEVGTGKSMLIDLFAECLPNRKKRRWHFNTFMLDTFSRLETLRKSQLTNSGALQDEYSLLVLARDLIETSPILFLDEFQLPDRAASKILSNLMTSFFQLGGVLIATSNRMPDELAKAAGVEFSRPMGRLSRLGWRLGLGGIATKEDGPGQKGEFAIFLEVLKSRCEVWEMDGKRDYRKIESEEGHSKKEVLGPSPPSNTSVPSSGVGQNSSSTKPSAASEAPITSEEVTLPKNYLILPPPTADQATLSSYDTSLNSILETATSHLHPIPWTPSILTVYGRKLHIPTQYSGVALFTFDQLCGAALGPADYITIASTYHTIILTDIPILTFIQKNEARRLITLLDALYEAKCRLLITAATDPDSLLFPEPVVSAAHNTTPKTEELIDDAVHSETYSEIHQDLTSPFRPNISSYSPGLLAADALEDDPPNRFRRPGTSYTDERKLGAEGAKTPDFTNIRGLTGEDERFAVKRAQSRIWEMCSGRWWDRGASISVEANCMGNENGWWRPLPLSSRHWEHSATSASPSTSTIPPSNPSSQENTSLSSDSPSQDQLFSHDTSPFRTTTDPPPKIAWPHVWGTVKWGKRAGTWGKGVEGLGERKKEKDGDGDADGRSVGNGQEKVKEKEKEKIETSLLDKGRSVGDDDR